MLQGAGRGGLADRHASSTSRSRSTAARGDPRGHGLARPAAWTSRRSPSHAPREDHPRVDAIRRSGSRPSRRARLAFGLGLTGDQFKAGVALIRNLFRAYLAKDCSLAEINPLVVTKDGRVLALDAKLNFDDNALFRHPEIVGAARRQRGDPLDVEASKLRPQLHQARRQRRLHGQRRRPGHGHHGHRQARGRRARQLPRRGRRRLARADRERLPHPVVRPEREGGLHQRVRRHPARATGWPRGIIAAVQEARAHAAGGACGWRAPTWSRARRCSPSPASTSPAPTTWARARAKVVGAGPGQRAGVSILVDKNDPRAGAGHHRQGGRLPRRALQGVRHPGRGRRHARQGRHHPRGLRRCGTPWRRRSKATGADCALIFVPPPAAADAIMEAADAGHAARRLHHRGRAGGRHGAGQGLPRADLDAGSSAPTARA